MCKLVIGSSEVWVFVAELRSCRVHCFAVIVDVHSVCCFSFSHSYKKTTLNFGFVTAFTSDDILMLSILCYEDLYKRCFFCALSLIKHTNVLVYNNCNMYCLCFLIVCLSLNKRLMLVCTYM